MLTAAGWKSAEIPFISEWLSKVKYMGLMSKLSAICNYGAGEKKCSSEVQYTVGIFPAV